MIDETDRQIILLLQENGRLSNAALAEATGLPVSTVHERVKKLEKRGVITGYGARVDAAVIGKPIIAFVRLTVGTPSDSYLEAKNNLKQICLAEPDVLECHSVAGEDCYVLKVRAGSPQDLEKLVERLRCSAPVSKTVTSIVLSTIKESPVIVPAGPAASVLTIGKRS